MTEESAPASAAVVQAIHRRERRRKFWRSLTWLSKAGCIAGFICAVAGVSGVVVSFLISSVSLFFASLVTVGIGMVGGLLSSLMHKLSQRKFYDSGDPLFGSQTYHFLLKSLRALGIKEPALYLDSHRENAKAYKEVHFEYVSVHEHQLIESTGEADTNAICRNAHEVAFLVFPGTKELARTQPLLRLIRGRGVTDPDTLRELVNETDERPLSLSEGAL